jgi:dTDP-4-amino-4,6-dideoxygalactose transaminase
MCVTERLATQVLSLPMYPELLSGEVEQVIEAVNSHQSACAA